MPDPLQFPNINSVHLFSCINTIVSHVEPYTNTSHIRILDLGCGNGELLATMSKAFNQHLNHINVELYGLDVNDSLVQPEGYFHNTIKLLDNTVSTIDWKKKLYLVNSTDSWPYENSFFDFIISNQVLEHVSDHHLVFAEIHRTLKEDGFSFHLFPLRHTIFELHVMIPIVHKLNTWTSKYHFIRFFSLLGLGRYRVEKRIGKTHSISNFAENWADKLTFQVNYLTSKQISKIAKSHFLRASFDFTFVYYKQKMLSLLKMKPKIKYSRRDIFSFKNTLSVFPLKFISSVTLVLRKKESNASGNTITK